MASKSVNQRKKIVEIAARLMSQKGYKGTSLQDIANLAGIHKSTLFHYFNSKEEMLLAVLRIGIEDVANKLDLIINDENMSPEEKLRQALINHLDSLVNHIDHVNVYHSEIRFLSEKNKRKYLKMRKYYASCFQQIIKEIKEKNPEYLSGLDDKIITFGILGMCNWVVKWFKKNGSHSALDIADIFYQMSIQR